MAASVFTGALMPKKKQDLQEIAVALKISDQGTKDDLMNRIKRHLDTNPDLEEDPSFAGLYGTRRKRSLQPQPLPATSIGKPSSRGRRSGLLDPVRESTPVNDLRDVSMFLKNPTSPAEDVEISTPEQSPKRAVAITPSSLPALPLSAAKSVVERLASSKDVEILTAKIKENEVLQHSVEMLERCREFLSNSRNVWSATAVMEYIYIIYSVIPWKTGKIPLLQLQDTTFSLPYCYPPLATLQTSAFWLILFHWLVPTALLPIIAGSLISTTPRPASQSTASDQAGAASSPAPFDPLSAAIIRLVVQANYPYASLSVKGADVLGWDWRVWNAGMGLLFAFSERLSASPQTTAHIIQVEKEKERLQLENSESPSVSPAIRRRALMSSSHLAEEVD
ncbi:hypothetical protein H0H92_014587 [Tricholoma furcatifolium]|nr:hypothetical protein H0H92_014587 [Tricholoma furcatifolium]